MTAAAATGAAVFLVMLWLLIVGEPASRQTDREQVGSLQTQVAYYQTAVAFARPTPTACYYGTIACHP